MISIVSSSLKEPRLALTLAMRERLTQTTVLAVGVSGLEDIKRIEAECEVSGVTKLLLKAYLMLPPE